MGIVVYNRTIETHTGPDNYPIYRPNILGNPYDFEVGKKTLAIYKVRNRDEAIERYSSYFDMMYSGNVQFKAVVDEIYEKYKSGKTVYLECYCAPKPCHGDIIKQKLEQRLLREKIREINDKYKEKKMAEIL